LSSVPSATRSRFSGAAVALGSVVLLAAVLRLWGLGHHLPYLPQPGEAKSLRVTLTMLYEGTWNPGFFHYPSLPFYLYRVSFSAWSGLAELLGAGGDLGLVERVALGSARVQEPALIWIARGWAAAAGTATVALVALSARELTGRLAPGPVAGLLLALSPLHLHYSHVARHDVYLAFFAALVLWGSVRIHTRGRTVDFLWAGLACGLAMSCKYNGWWLLVVPCAAVLARGGLRALVDPRLLGVGLLATAALLLTSPFLLLDFDTFREDFLYEVQHYASDHVGRDRGGVGWYGATLLEREGLVPVLALGTLVWGAWSRRRPVLVSGAFVVSYGAFIHLFPVKVDRVLLPLVPYLAVLAAIGLGELFGRSPRLRGLGLVLLAASLGGGLALSVRTLSTLTAPDARDEAREWLEETLEPGSLVALESFGPFLDPGLHDVRQVPAGRGFSALWVHEPDWYVERGFDLVVLSSGTYGRFRRDRRSHPEAWAGYQALLGRFEEVRRFEGGGQQVWVYRPR